MTSAGRIWVGQSGPAQVTGILDLARAAAEADGVSPLSEHGLLRVRHGGIERGAGSGQDVVAVDDGRVVGYAYLDEPDGTDVTGELVVDPARRRQGLGAALVGALAARADGHTMRLWAHGDLAAAAALAASAGFERFRALWQMRRPLGEPLPGVAFPPGTSLRAFVSGQDEDEWLRLNGRAFAKHPEQGSWTRRDLELREQEPWFDPAGFLIAERKGAMAGFHWTKIHTDGDKPVGEVYVLGVDPDAHGGGLGKALTVAGLEYLRDRGLDEVMLYVDEDNTAAIRLYQDLGFARWRADAMYRRPGTADALE